MLRLSPDIIAAAISPAGLLLSRINRLTRREKQHQSHIFASPLALSEALEQLDQQLAQAEWRGAAGLRVVLSNHWLRFAVVPWSDELRSPSERQALAQGLIEDIYAEKATRFDIRISESGYGRPGLAAALSQNALLQLQELAQRHGLALQSLQPLLMQAFAHQARQLNGSDYAFACLEPGKLTVLIQQQQRWQNVLSRSLSFGQSQAVAPLLTQLFAQLDSLPQQVLLACHGVDTRLESVAGVPVRTLPAAPGWPTPPQALAGV